MSELALDDRERNAFASELHSVGMPQLVRGKAPANAGLSGGAAQLGADRGSGPRPPTRGAVDHAEQRTDGQLRALGEPCAEA